jgi:hypothetical protein
MGSGAMIYIPSYIKIVSGIQKLMEGGGVTDTQKHRQHGNRMGLLRKVAYEITMLAVSVNPPCQLLNASTNLYETWYVYHGT